LPCASLATLTSSAKDISADTIRAYDDCDVMLTEFINPESPKMISILVQDMNPEGEVDPLISRIPVPLYICLTEEQMYDIALQYGLDVHRSAFEDPADISALPITLIPCNRGSGYRHHKVGQIRPCRVEGFINEVIGRMDRLTTNNSGNWDTKEKYFQTIDFKFRVGPRNSVVVKSIRNIQRGQRTETNSRAKSGQRELTQQQREQYGDEEGMFSSENKYDYQDPQFEPEKDINENGKKTERDQVLDNIGEDGTSHAAMLEWRFQLTTHVLMSPQLQAAFVQVAGIIERPLETHGDLEPILANRAMRGHLTTLLEYEMLQGETSLRVYTDPRAQDAALKRRMYSAYCLRNNG